MKITIYHDDTVSLDLDCIANNITRLAPGLTVVKGKSPVLLYGFFILSPETYKSLPARINRETADSDEVLIFTDKSYDNNYFFESYEKKVIISFSRWESLTTLSRNNGAVYFLCAILIRSMIGEFRHDDRTGCISDFWMDKTTIDIGMRSAFICIKCLDQLKKRSTPELANLLTQIQEVLNDLSAASRANMDICDYWNVRDTEETYDVFICHNSEEKDAIRKMNRKLQDSKVRTWFDEDQLPPGRLWQEILEKQIALIKTAAVFVGRSGVGPWHHIEIRAFLDEFAQRGCPVIPVILPDCESVPELPLFLRQLTWVDFRKATPDPFNRLLWGITGRKP